jgi:DNA-binding protein YbaB
MTPEEKQEIVKQWLIAAIVAAENAIKEQGAGQEKLQMVIDKFNDKAPMLCKIILKFTNTKTLKDLIDEALNTVKDAFEKKQ